MNKTDTPAKVASNDQLGLSAEAPTLVERLRERAGQYDECGWHEKIEREAADEIERLRAALLIGHTYAECCPTPASPDDRDADCQACIALGPNV